MNQNSLAGKRILIFQQRGWGLRIGHFLAQKLQDQGCHLAALTMKRSTHQFIVKQTAVKYDLIISNDQVMSQPIDYLAGDNFSLAEICQALGVDSIWPLVATERTYVRSYKDKYYYSFKQNVSDEVIIAFVKAIYKYIKIIADQFSPQIIIAPNIISLPHIMVQLYFAKRGVKMIAVTDSKVPGVNIFTHNFYEDQGYFYDYLDQLNRGLIESPNRQRARIYLKEFREKFKQADQVFVPQMKLSWQKMIRRQLAPYYHILLWYLKRPMNELASTGITLDYRPPRIILRDYYCQKIYQKFMKNFSYYSLADIDQYVYFPLQFQPEASIDVMAPFFSNQIETARQIAMSLPDGYTLVVKEHPAMVGLRPPSYIEKIHRTPNVKLVDYRITTEEILKRADLVISPSSTTLVEAAFYYKPAIQLGNLGTTLRLPNVFQHTNLTTLSLKIKEVLKINLKNDDYERRLENYVAAAYDTGFTFNYWGVWERGEKDNMEILWQAWQAEILRVLNKKNEPIKA